MSGEQWGGTEITNFRMPLSSVIIYQALREALSCLFSNMLIVSFSFCTGGCKKIPRVWGWSHTQIFWLQLERCYSWLFDLEVTETQLKPSEAKRNILATQEMDIWILLSGWTSETGTYPIQSLSLTPSLCLQHQLSNALIHWVGNRPWITPVSDISKLHHQRDCDWGSASL